MKHSFISLSLAFLLCLCAFTAKAESKIHVTRKDLNHIKVLSSSSDKVHLYLKSNNQETYRISFLSENEAHTILDRFKTNDELLLTIQPVTNKSYLDVISWQ